MTDPYYSDDAVTLYHGDCREVAEWLAADVLVTDPPYGVAYSAIAGSRQHRKIAGDENFQVAAYCLDAWGGRPVAAFSNHASLVDTLLAVRSHHERTRVMTWHKTNVNGGTPGNPWLADVEFAVCGVAEWPRRAVSAVVRAPRSTGNPNWQKANQNAYLHPTQKPVALMEAVVNAFPPGRIADPFAGSGSTLVAAKRLGRRAIGVELDERYCETTARRLSQGVLDFGEAP